MGRVARTAGADVARDESVTIVVTRTVRVGCEAAYEAWLRAVSEAARRFEGHRGMTVVRPVHGGHVWTLIVGFDRLEQLRAWDDSEVRRALVVRRHA
jgi:antibiotic biosynthesis monooxygenase (ABM) superfamily enzyme